MIQFYLKNRTFIVVVIGTRPTETGGKDYETD